MGRRLALVAVACLLTWPVVGAPHFIESVDAVDTDGKIVLLDFWATWCPPCLAELPHLRKLDERFQGDRFILIGVALDTIEKRELRAFLLRHDVGWPQLHERRGTDSEIARRFDVEAVPTTVLIDTQGRIIARDLRGPALETVLETLISAEKQRFEESLHEPK